VSAEPRGELWAAMLDTKAGWDELIRRHAPNAAVRASVLANPLYQNIFIGVILVAAVAIDQYRRKRRYRT
jgi:hypothetical protein